MVLLSLPPHMCLRPSCNHWWYEIRKYEVGIFSIQLTLIPKFRETPFLNKSRKESGTKYGDHTSELMKVAQRGEESFYDFFF